MSESFLNGRVTLHPGDCLDVLATLPENSVDSCVTDPPYGLQFMGREWDKLWRNETEADAAYVERTDGELTSRPRKLPDYKATNPQQMQEWHTAWARQVYRVLKPGAHLLAFGGTRTYHRMACAIEDAGFEIRDCIQWLYGSGFPKSHDISKGLDRFAGVERQVIARGQSGKNSLMGGLAGIEGEYGHNITAPATDAARQWQGWGTALKPSHEDIILAQKPYNLRSLCEIVARKIMEALCQLPSFAKDAERNSLLSRSVFGAGFGSAQWNAVQKCNSPDDLFDLMATGQFGSGTPSSLNTALSWLLILDATLRLQNTFTTETETNLTTDLKILNSLLSESTQDCIIKAATQQSGTASNVLPVVAIFNAVAARVNCIHELSVLDPAILKESVGGFAPNCEPIVLARKPLSERTVAANVLRWGVGALNIDATRIPTDDVFNIPQSDPDNRMGVVGMAMQATGGIERNHAAQKASIERTQLLGRWPANVITDGSEEVVGAFPDRKTTWVDSTHQNNRNGEFLGQLKHPGEQGFNDEGSAARFFYTAKADADDRLGSKHPTVKPLDLMQYLMRLVTPKGGTVLDPFAGTGTTGEAAWREGMNAVLIEREAEYQADIRRRMELCLSGPDERQRESIKAKLKDRPLDHGPLFGAIA